MATLGVQTSASPSECKPLYLNQDAVADGVDNPINESCPGMKNEGFTVKEQSGATQPEATQPEAIETNTASSSPYLPAAITAQNDSETRHNPAVVADSMNAVSDTEASEPEAESITSFVSKTTSKAPCTDVHDESATSIGVHQDANGGTPVKQVICRLETPTKTDLNELERLKFRTKRDFFSETQQSISVSAEREKYDATIAPQGLKNTDQHLSPVVTKSVQPSTSTLSRVRNMASRFETKTEESLDDLSFRTVRSFFPKEKSIHVGAAKEKYEARKPKESLQNDDVRVFQNTDVENETTWKDGSTPAKEWENGNRPRRFTGSEDTSKVRGIASRFESKRAYSVVTAPVRTIDSFIVSDTDASVRVSAEKAKYENKTTTSMPVKRAIDSFLVADKDASVRVSTERAMFENQQKFATHVTRTIDSFIVPPSEFSVNVSAEKAKFETSANVVKVPKRTIDTFIVPENEASVCVLAEKARFENPCNMSIASTTRTIDTFIVAKSDASVCVSEEKEKLESLEKQVRGPVVRTIDTFIVPASEGSIRVGVEKTKLEALEKQKQKEMEAQAVLAMYKMTRVKEEKSKMEAKKKARMVEEDKERREGENKERQEVAAMAAEEKARLDREDTMKEIEMEEKARLEMEEKARMEEEERAEDEEKAKVKGVEKARLEEEEKARLEEARGDKMHELNHELPRSSPVRLPSFVEVTVEHQMLADVGSSAQHTHWLSIPVSVNPALARLHTVLNDQDVLTAYALYPSSPSSPSSPASD